MTVRCAEAVESTGIRRSKKTYARYVMCAFVVSNIMINHIIIIIIVIIIISSSSIVVL